MELEGSIEGALWGDRTDLEVLRCAGMGLTVTLCRDVSQEAVTLEPVQLGAHCYDLAFVEEFADSGVSLSLELIDTRIW